MSNTRHGDQIKNKIEHPQQPLYISITESSQMEQHELQDRFIPLLPFDPRTIVFTAPLSGIMHTLRFIQPICA